jgi:hypothetical protein
MVCQAADLDRAWPTDSFAGLPRAEDRVDEHHDVEGVATAAETSLAGSAVFPAGGGSQGVDRFREEALAEYVIRQITLRRDRRPIQGPRHSPELATGRGVRIPLPIHLLRFRLEGHPK